MTFFSVIRNEKHQTRIIWVLAAFYLLRAVIQKIFLFPFPVGLKWTKPSIPSLLVDYHHTNDFYFSGHCGFLTIMVLECWKAGRPVWGIFLTLCGLAYVSFVLILLRVHYSIGKIEIFEFFDKFFRRFFGDFGWSVGLLHSL